ncbi:MAG TPA: DUF4139 domain-containing protein [Phycisphaerae bacterium]|nr:DUF4139 domain-containing protein [Phycisphaerae bacterium]HNU46117.1 DUF4139 domain-containing protein [Phycisphaerae bacterium]
MAAMTKPAVGEEPAPDATMLTIYSKLQPGAVPPELYRPGAQTQMYGQPLTVPGYGVVKQERSLKLDAGRSSIRFTDVASQIDPTTVTFASLTDPAGTRVLEQNYEFDLVSVEKLMQRFLDQPIALEQVLGQQVKTIEGTLLSARGAVLLRKDDGSVQVVNGYSNVFLPQLPQGLITKPTLVWDVQTTQAGTHRTRVTYETEGLTWWADYNLIFAEGKDANSGLLDVGAWVSIVNQSGATYRDARLKLIAGEVHRAPQPEPMMARGARAKMAMAESAMDMGFEEKEFFEYHLYTLGRPTTLPDNSTKQLELFPLVAKVPCEKVLVYYGLAEGYRGFFASPMVDRNYGTQGNKKVDIYLKFKNEKGIGMGMPLPGGRIRVSKLDPADGTLEFIGEDKIDHTPKDEIVLIKMGSAFDVVGERTQTDFQIDTKRNWLEETVEIKVRNHKKEAVNVIVKENLFRWLTWEIKQATQEYEKADARTVHFPVKIEPDGEVTIRYTARYTW